MVLTKHGFIEDHGSNEDEEHCPHVIWSALEGCLKDALEVVQTEEILRPFSFTTEISPDITVTLKPGISWMYPWSSGLLQKHHHVGHVNYIKDKAGAKNPIVADQPTRRKNFLDKLCDF